MKVQSKPDYLIFADGAKTGELESFPNVERGWGVTIDQTQSKPPLEWMNGAFNRVDARDLYMLQQGIPEWDASITYPVDAITKYKSVLYIAILANDNATPSTSTTKWKKLISDIASASTSQKGIVQLSSDVNSESETTAATSKAVKAAYDLASTASQNTNFLPLSGGNLTGALTINNVAVLKAGDYGVGGSVGAAISDFDEHLKCGFYGFNTKSLANNPSGFSSSSACIAVMPTNSPNWKTEILTAVGGSTPKIYYRTDTSSGKGDWFEGITTANIANYAVGVGINQKWYDMTDSRAKGTTYTNNTGAPIQIAIVVSQSGSAINTITIDGVALKVTGNQSTTAERSISMIIPNGSTYMLNLNFVGWNELR